MWDTLFRMFFRIIFQMCLCTLSAKIINRIVESVTYKNILWWKQNKYGQQNCTKFNLVYMGHLQSCCHQYIRYVLRKTRNIMSFINFPFAWLIICIIFLGIRRVICLHKQNDWSFDAKSL